MRVTLFNPAAERAELGPSILAEINAVASSGTFILGPIVTAAENSLLAHINSTIPSTVSNPVPVLHCIGLSSGTDALQIALRTLDVTASHSVVTTPFTWLSSATAIPLAGAKVIFADICPDTYCLTPASVAAAIKPSTRAVISVSLFGRVPDYAALRRAIDAAAAKYGTKIALIEDGAQSFGAVGDDGWPSCASPHVDIAITSFFPSKTLGCYGDGGALFTRNEDVASVVKSMRAHGKDPKTGLCVRLGMNARFDAVQAAVLLAKLPVFRNMIDSRVMVGKRYAEGLQEDKRVVLPELGGGESLHVFGVYTIRVRERDKVARLLREARIGCAVYYEVCVHQQPLFSGEGVGGTEARDKVVLDGSPSFPVAEHVSKYVLSLPVHAYLSEADQKIVIAALRDALDKIGISEPPPPAPAVE